MCVLYRTGRNITKGNYAKLLFNVVNGHIFVVFANLKFANLKYFILKLKNIVYETSAFIQKM